MKENPRYNVIVSDCAKSMLGMHIRFLANVNTAAAMQKKSEIIKGIRSLATMPERFPFLDEEYILPNKYHKMFIEKWFLSYAYVRADYGSRCHGGRGGADTQEITQSVLCVMDTGDQRSPLHLRFLCF
ncbi:hypothetical protein AGMMS49957_15930 [Synergistales bacterium]|nr:hypothetical protein AGMMS49957_15930 [Synergistales bacterium]